MSKSMSYVNKGKTIKELIYNTAEKFPDRNAFKIKEKGVVRGETFAQLKDDVEALGTSLFARGFKNAKIGIIGENSFPWFYRFWQRSAADAPQCHTTRDLQRWNWKTACPGAI